MISTLSFQSPPSEGSHSSCRIPWKRVRICRSHTIPPPCLFCAPTRSIHFACTSMKMRFQRLATHFLAACLFFAVALLVDPQNDLYNHVYSGGKHGTVEPKPNLTKGMVNLRRTGSLISSCTNHPSSRQCWYGGFDILTDVDETWPFTGKTVYVRAMMPRLATWLGLADTIEYTLIIRNTTCNPDGHASRTCLLINDQYPGPTLQAGQSSVVTFYNKLYTRLPPALR